MGPSDYMDVLETKLRAFIVISGLFTLACGPAPVPGAGGETGTETGTSTGDGDGDPIGDGDGDPIGDGDGDPAGDGDGDPIGDGDGDPIGDGDGDPVGDGDGDIGDGDGDIGDGDGDIGDGDGDIGDGDGDIGDGDGDIGDGDGDIGDGDGDIGDGDGDIGDGDGDIGDGDGDIGDGDGDIGDGDGDNGGDIPDGGSCVSDDECQSNQCYLIPFLGGLCGECNEDADCNDGGCTPPNPFSNVGSVCNNGEAGGGCETDAVCQDGLTCQNAFDLLGLIQLNSCSECASDLDCGGGEVCAPIVEVASWDGQLACTAPASLPQNSYCDLESNGDQVCSSGICASIDIMGLAEIGSCGECNTDADCGGGQVCVEGEFILDTGTLIGSTCQ